MRLTGQMYELDMDGYDFEVKEAVVTNLRIAMDWDEGDEHFHAVLHSEDGGTAYVGNFGSPELDSEWVMEGTRFMAKNGEVLLWLEWYQKDRGVGGQNIIHLASTWE